MDKSGSEERWVDPISDWALPFCAWKRGSVLCKPQLPTEVMANLLRRLSYLMSDGKGNRFNIVANSLVSAAPGYCCELNGCIGRLMGGLSLGILLLLAIGSQSVTASQKQGEAGSLNEPRVSCEELPGVFS